MISQLLLKRHDFVFFTCVFQEQCLCASIIIIKVNSFCRSIMKKVSQPVIRAEHPQNKTNYILTMSQSL